MPYSYHAKIVRVIDGDTVVADVDLGFGVWLRGLALRLAGLNTPELHGAAAAAGQAARQRLANLVLDRDVSIDTHQGQEKYGRWLATIFVPEGIVNDLLIAEKLAVPWDGHGARPADIPASTQP